MRKIFLIPLLAILVLSTVNAGWYNTNYPQKRALNITESSGIGNLVNYTIRLNITYDGDMQADFDDLLFTNTSETANLSYWIEKQYNSDHVIVWVRTDNLTTNGNTTIYMYYGNSTAGNFSNISNTFLVWDDFGAFDTTRWNLTENNAGGASCSIVNNALNCTGGSGTSYYVTYTQANLSHISILTRAQSTGQNQKIGTFMRGIDMWFGDKDNRTLYYAESNHPNTNPDTRITMALDNMTTPSSSTTSDVITADLTQAPIDYARYEFNGWQGNFTWKKWHDGGISEELNFTLFNISGNSTNLSSGYAGLRGMFNDKRSIFDWIRIRSYVEPEPTAAFLAEERFINISLNSPNNASLFGTSNVSINCTTISNLPGVNITNITLFINGTVNHTINGTNSTRLELFRNLNFNQGVYEWTCRATNNNNNIFYSQTNNTFTIENLVVRNNQPLNNTWTRNRTNVNFNCTGETGSPDSLFLYGNFTGTFSLNQTIRGINSTELTTFRVNLTQGFYSWSCAGNTTLSNTIFFVESNRTLGVDELIPNLTINNITVQSRTDISFNSTVVDSYLGACRYAIYNSSGAVDSGDNNVSFTCNSIVTGIIVDRTGDYNLTIISNDSAGNQNISTLNFSIGEPGVSSSGGGGGGGGIVPSEDRLPVIGLQNIQNPKLNYDNLTREVLYAQINFFCGERETQSVLAAATQEYDDVCQLTTNDLKTIKTRISNFSLNINDDDLIPFYQNYKKRMYFQGLETKSTIDKYRLFTKILGSVSTLQLTPARIDTPLFIYVPGGIPKTITPTLISNKPLKSCEVITNTTALTCLVTNTTLIVQYNLSDTNFFNKKISGIISVTTDVQKDSEREVLPVSVIYDIYNFGVIPQVLLFIIPTALLIGGLFIYKVVKRQRKYNVA